MFQGGPLRDSSPRVELRRSPRSGVRIPIALRHEGERFKGTTFVVNAHGALVGAHRNIPLGDRFEVPDGMMLIGWFVAGAAYYQMLRNPKVIVALLDGLRAAVNRVKSGAV